MLTLANRLQGFITEKDLFNKDQKLLLAFSGGVDSVVLADLLLKNNYRFGIAHCNFQLRGEESEGDQEFAENIHAPLGVHTRRFDTKHYAADTKTGIQEAARNLRYEWFGQLMEQEGFDLLLTAHHRDDNIETVLMNFFKGTGIRGLQGILPARHKIVRPLIFASKKEIIDHANKQGLFWREDSSNASDKYRRNNLRHEIIPAIATQYPGFEENMAANIERFNDAAIIYRAGLERMLAKLVEEENGLIKMPVNKLRKMPALLTVLYEVLEPYGFSPAQLKEAMKLLDSETGKYISSAKYRLLNNRGWLMVIPLESRNEGLIVIEKEDKLIEFAEGSLELGTYEAGAPIIKDQDVAMIDGAEIKFPLLLRKWKQGDYFYPLGMQKKKKLSRFFIDNKLSLADKEYTWVIESAKRIIWVVGLRLDDRFKVRPNSSGYTVKFRRYPGVQAGLDLKHH